MTGSGRQYAVLALLLLAAGSFEVARLVQVAEVLLHHGEVPAAPFAVQPATRMISDGPLRGDEILSLDGHPLVGAVQYDDAVRRAHPGDKLHLVLSEPSGHATEKMVAIPGRSTSRIATVVRLDVLVPFLCLAIGFSVALNRRRETNVWIVWLALLGFAGFAAIAMLIFSIYFPARFAPDSHQPWAKYIFLIPAFATEVALWIINGIWRHDIAASQAFASTYTLLSHVRIVIDVLSVLGFFVVLGMKSRTEHSPDELRRLRILRAGSLLAFSAMLLAGVAGFIQAFAFCALALFAVTLVYVIVADRAMDLSVIIRNTVRSVYPSKKFDKKVFPEAYNAEVLLSELALETGRYAEMDPLFETIARRIDDALHVEDIVILVREGNVCRTRYSTRHGEPMDIALNSHILPEPGARLEPRQVFPDRPQPWMRSLDMTELQTLAYMRSEVLLVLTGQGSQVAGLMSLGAKKSGEAYSPVDLRLLQTLADRLGMAIHNSTV